MTPTEIADALSEIARAPFDAHEFGYVFAEATDNAPATVAKLRGGSYNRSDIQGGVLLNKKFHFAPAAPGFLEATLDALRASKATAKNKPAMLLACDGEMVSAEHCASGETRHFAWAELGDHFGFFLPAAGKERYKAADENPVDVKVSGKLPEMLFGNMPRDGGHLILDDDDRTKLIDDGFGEFVKYYMGSEEVVKGFRRHCLWIPDDRQDYAREHPIINARLASVAAMRNASDAGSTRDFAARSHRFVQIQGVAVNHAILVPSVTSERRPYLPFDRVGADTIASNLNFAIYDAPDWCMSLIGSRLHLVWIGTVCGKLKSDFRYSNTLGWNTFPAPRFTEAQLEALTASARKILRTSYAHFPKTIADLYDPDKMPEDLRQAHKENDDLLESMYIGRPFRNDTERLEHLFKLYAARVKQIAKDEASAKASKKKGRADA
jgi:hypothetical protein